MREGQGAKRLRGCSISEPIDWLPDGTPFNPRFGDRYHSESGLAQARGVFLRGCGLPEAWAGQPQWRILETGFGFGLNFLATWAAWRADPARPALLHFVSVEAFPVSAEDLLRATAHHPEVAPLAQELAQQWWGLLPGVHRLRFDGGRVLLTLCIGDAQTFLRQQNLTVDAVYLDGFDPRCNPDIWSLHTLKAVARCCRRGTRLATWTVSRAVREALAQVGFAVSRVPGVPPKRANLQASFAPHWEPRAAKSQWAASDPVSPGPCIVIGGGIAGASVAASLARRGWHVQVLDQGSAPGAGASGLPAGLFAPHVSPDDSVLSRLSRSGVRATLQQAAWCLREGVDWSPTGVLEHRTDGSRGIPAQWLAGEEPADRTGRNPGLDWSEPAPAALLAEVQLPPSTTACWHHRAGWIRPTRLAAALLAQPGITWRGGAQVDRLQRAEGESDPWQALDPEGRVLAEAPTVVIAAGAGSRALLGQSWRLQAVRGQVSWAVHEDSHAPPVSLPVNGHGNLVPSFPWGDRADSPHAWVMGSTFERGIDSLPTSPAEQEAAHATNRAKLEVLLPGAAPRLQAAFAAGRAHTWAGVRCTSPDRLPIVGPVDADALPGIWTCTAMGARGLTLAVLCGELLAARLQGESLPLDSKLAHALAAERFTSRP